MFEVSDDVASDPNRARTVLEVVAILHVVDLAVQYTDW
jgi:hypothetical protein